jgi:hypothetical protein
MDPAVSGLQRMNAQEWLYQVTSSRFKIAEETVMGIPVEGNVTMSKRYPSEPVIADVIPQPSSCRLTLTAGACIHLLAWR